MSWNSADRVSNRYELVERLGQGGMGTVYRAFDRLNRQTVALKKVGTPVEKLQFSASRDSDNIRLALAVEFRTLASLRHPNIISVLDYGFDTDGQPYFTMELLPNAQPITQAGKDQPLEIQVRYLNQLLMALAYLHRRGVIHRDLKPDNVLVACNGQVKVLDFGLASGAALQSFTDYTEKLGGTLAYMAPELFSGLAATRQSDLYAVGMMAYEMFLRQYPFNMQHPALIFGDILTKVPDTSALPPDLAALLNCLLVKTPTARPDSAERVTVALCGATGEPLPPEDHSIRESFLQASKFVGRERELNQLRDILQTTHEGESAFVLIGGESGVGKSRLVDELRIRALVKGVTVLRGQGIADSSLPFQLWRDPARRLALSTPMTDLEAGILKAIVPDISTILRRRHEIPDAPEVTGSAWQQRIVFTLVDLFKRQKSPILLILEDLQWAIESLAVLRHMLLMKEGIPGLCIVGTYRNDERPDLPVELSGIQVLSLKPLDAAAIASLSESMLGEAGKQPEVLDLLQRETEGNAFFMVEVVRALAEDAGRLADIGRMTLPEHVFAGGVQQVVRRRLSGLPESVRNWLKMVAVAGRQLDLALIDHLTFTTQPDLLPNTPIQEEREQGLTLKLKQFIPALRDEILMQCANAAVLEIVEEVWRFRHDKLREALLSELSEEEIRWFNRRVAETLETLYPDDNSYDHILLEHWHQAGNVDREIYYLNRVAESLIEIIGVFEFARTLLGRGLARLADDDLRRISLWKWEARSYMFQGYYDRARSLTYKAFELAKRSDDLHITATMLDVLGELAFLWGDYEQANDYWLQSLGLFQDINERQGIASALYNLAMVLMQRGDYQEAQHYYIEGLSLFQVVNDRSGIAKSYNALGLLSQRLKDYERATEYHHQSMTIAQEIGHQIGIGYNLFNLGAMAFSQGDYERACDYYQESLNIRRAISDRRGTIQSLNCLGFVYLAMQDQRSQATLYEALTYAETIRVPSITLDSLACFAGIYCNKSNPSRAWELIGLIQHHPTYNTNLQIRIDVILPQLETALSREELNAAMERGKVLDLDKVVVKLLDEFSAE